MDDATKNGACKAFSYYWMHCHKTRADFWRFILTPSGIIKIRDAQAHEQTAGTSFDRDWVRPNEVLTGLGFTPVGQGMADVNPMRADEVAAELVKNPGYKLISIRGVGGGHAICGYVTSAEALFFDPNFGEITFFTPMNLGYWFVDWWKSCDFYVQQLGQRGLVRTYA
jgi:hypothetical protein